MTHEEYQFNEKYSHYVEVLPPYILKRVSKDVMKVYKTTNVESDYVEYVFNKYSMVYNKELEYKRAFYRNNKQKFNTPSKKLLQENERLRMELESIKMGTVTTP